MTIEQLLDELKCRNALIVHCSRPGKGDERSDAKFFPDDLKYAAELCDRKRTEICCSVIWPGHVETFGDIGIILKPRSTEAITLVCSEDCGSYVNPLTGRRDGSGVPFSRDSVLDTFNNSKGYNEWCIDDADLIGIFVKSRRSELVVAVRIDPNSGDLNDSAFINTGIEIITKYVEFCEIVQAFPCLPILTIEGSAIVNLNGQNANPYEESVP